MVCDLLIKNATLVLPYSVKKGDIAISDGKISQIGPDLPHRTKQTIDAEHLIVFPGVIETHAHMLLPFAGTQTMNDFYCGTKAGAYGGVTTLIDFADQKKGNSALQAYEERRQQTDGNCAVDYSLHCTLTDINPETLRAIPILMEKGVTSFKFYTTYSDGGLYVSPDHMKLAFREIARCGGIATVHAEEESIILAQSRRLKEQGKTGIKYYPDSKPDTCEEAAVRRVIELAKETGAAVLIRHVSSAAGARLIYDAQKCGYPVFGETCPHYLYFTREVYDRPDGADFIVHPSIRTAADREALWDILENQAVFTIGTDDCAFYRSQKRVSNEFDRVPGGFAGIETRTLIMYELGVCQRGLSLDHLGRLLSLNASKLYGLYPQKGAIQVGADADLFIIDPLQTTIISHDTLHENTDYTVFEGFVSHAAPVYTISNGKIIVDHGRDLMEKGAGRWLVRNSPDWRLRGQ